VRIWIPLWRLAHKSTLKLPLLESSKPYTLFIIDTIISTIKDRNESTLIAGGLYRSIIAARIFVGCSMLTHPTHTVFKKLSRDVHYYWIASITSANSRRKTKLPHHPFSSHYEGESIYTRSVQVSVATGDAVDDTLC
jgi:hypothetical protein